MSELEGCPFCGCKCEFVDDVWVDGDHAILCPLHGLDCEIKIVEPSEWNRRTAPTVHDALERARAALLKEVIHQEEYLVLPGGEVAEDFVAWGDIESIIDELLAETSAPEPTREQLLDVYRAAKALLHSVPSDSLGPLEDAWDALREAVAKVEGGSA